MRVRVRGTVGVRVRVRVRVRVKVKVKVRVRGALCELILQPSFADPRPHPEAKAEP